MTLDLGNHENNQDLFEVQERLWLTADRERLVPEGDPDAAFLFATTGQTVALAEAERFGLVKAAKKPAKAKVADGDDNQEAK